MSKWHPNIHDEENNYNLSSNMFIEVQNKRLSSILKTVLKRKNVFVCDAFLILKLIWIKSIFRNMFKQFFL